MAPGAVAPLRPLAHLPALVVATLAFINAGLYIAYAGHPLAMADAWYFIDAFLAKAYEHGVGLLDLYVKRPGNDHAQPIQKLLLLANAKWFHLDFVLEAFAGLAMALGTYLVLHAMIWQDQRRLGNPGWFFAAVASMIAMTIVSLNSSMVFNWSLVTLGYLPHLLVVIAAWACWRSLRGHGNARFALIFVFMAFTLDTMAMIAGASLAGATLLAGMKRGAGWRRVGAVAATVVFCLVAYRLASRLYLHASLPPEQGAGALEALAGSATELPSMLVTVLGSSLAHMTPLTFWFGDGARDVQTALAIAVASAHLWFWWRAWRAPWNATVFTATTMMLMFYASVAGIIVGRVPIFGPGYLHEPRYVLTWQMGNVALLMMLAGASPLPRRRPRAAAIGSGLLLFAMLALQVQLSRHTWDEGRYIQSYIHTMARQMYLLGLDPQAKPASCVPMLTICEAGTGERVRSITFLKRHHLNAYSDEVLQRYSLQAVAAPPPDAGTDAATGSPAPPPR